MSSEQPLAVSRHARHSSRDSKTAAAGLGAAPASDEASFWIPQATPDGRLFYYNTLTGVSILELPLDSSSSGTAAATTTAAATATAASSSGRASGTGLGSFAMSGSLADNGLGLLGGLVSAAAADSGPRDRSNVYIPDHTPVPPELIGERTGRRAGNDAGNPKSDNPFTSTSDQVSWSKILDGIAGAVERYRRAINNTDRAEFVLRAEHISDHLRLLFAAGSGTTDNHSGNPSIISNNRALFPHYRLTMSRFSKLVLSSHIAASDWPPPDSITKCLSEAKGFLSGVQSFIDVARSQRGENLPCLIPMFEQGRFVGGNWRGDGFAQANSVEGDGAFDEAMLDETDDDGMEDEHSPDRDLARKSRRKLQTILDRIEQLRLDIMTEITALYGLDSFGSTARTVSLHMQNSITAHACRSASRLLEKMTPWVSTLESVSMAGIGLESSHKALADFCDAKQKTYDLVADLVLNIQDLASPLPDEWSTVRVPSFDARLNAILSSTKELESTLWFSITVIQSALAETKPKETAATGDVDHPSLVNIGSGGDITKVERFFGGVPAGLQATISTSSPDVPPFLRLDYEVEIAYEAPKQTGADGQQANGGANGNGPQLRGGSLIALVEQLTRHDRLDSQFNSTFLLTYKSFTSASALFEILMSRWAIQPPPGLAGSDLQLWSDRKQKPIRFRVVNILKTWIETYWVEDDSAVSRELLERVHGFARDEVVKTNTPGSGPLLSVIDQRLKSDIRSVKKMIPVNSPMPPPILPKNIKKLKFLDIDPTEFARQLTIIESRLYARIQPWECLNKAWGQKKGEPDDKACPNIKKWIRYSNDLSVWVAHMILMQKDLRPRVIVIKHFVVIANRCMQLNNFSTATAITSAFTQSAIHRLNRTWAAVSTKTRAILNSLRQIMDTNRNYGEYRIRLQKVIAPCIPFFGMYLTDLTFIEDGMPSVIKKTNLINFAKRAKMADVIRSIQSYQAVPYALQPVQPLIDYIDSNLKSAKEMQVDLYDISLQVEPRAEPPVEPKKVPAPQPDRPSQPSGERIS